MCTEACEDARLGVAVRREAKEEEKVAWWNVPLRLRMEVVVEKTYWIVL